MNIFPILKRLQGKRKSLGSLLLPAGLCAAALLTATSCDMVNEDLQPCAPAPRLLTIVNFEYKYNMSPVLYGEEQDWFDSHAGSVYLYVFDEDGVYIDRYEKHREFFKPGEDFSMTFTDAELKQGKTYDLVAVAQGNTIGYVDDDDYQWYKVVNPMVPGESTIRDYILKLDRDSNNDGFSEVGIINYKDQYGQTKQMIDTLWTTKPDEVQRVTIPTLDYKPSVEQQPDVVKEVDIPMMRITNSVKVNLVNPDYDPTFDPNIYHIVIYFPKGNGTVDFCGDISQSTQELYYQSLIKEMVPYTPKQTRASGSYDPNDPANNQYALQARFGVSRLMEYDGSTLQIRDATNPEDGYPVLLEIPFSDTLKRLSEDTGFDDQEFLDREYDWQLDITVDRNLIPGYLDISCNLLSWARRIFFYDL